MSGERVGDLVLLGILVLLLLASAYNGFYGGSSATHYADTPGMKVATAVVYGGTSVGTGLPLGIGRFVLLGLLVRAWHRTSHVPCTAHRSPDESSRSPFTAHRSL